ncbi:MAG: efflux RND transporter periplasmic adaptor subunit [Treponema sp.]|jgi:multidrug efflux pump subunit AcrA (membrane-fusion protein)|nr:efflux RND transporter periplasmic adaptor subunit [Treponema sp.]
MKTLIEYSRGWSGHSKQNGPAQTSAARSHSAGLPACTGLALLLYALAACGGQEPGGPGGEQEAPIFAVNTSTAVQGQIWDYIALSGDIVAGSTVDVYSDVAGRVTRVYVNVGSRVNRGTPIAAVDPSKPGMNYVPGVAGAPISGVVVALPAQVGATVSQAVPLARISGGDALEIKLYVAERFISKVAMNQPCEISLDAWPGEIFRGTVTEVSPVVDPVSRTMEVKVNVANQGNKLKEGMFAKVKLITAQKENIVKIPASALVQRFGESYVFVAEEVPPPKTGNSEEPKKPGFFTRFFAGILGRLGKKEPPSPPKAPAPPPKEYVAKKRLVTPGILIDGALEIQGGLKPNEEFIVKGQTQLNDGSRINIVEKTAPLGAERQ